MRLLAIGGAKFAKVDDEDYEKLSTVAWFAHVRGNTVYAAPVRSGVPMHHFVIGTKPPILIDHVNGDGLDNQKHNLRQCTKAQNAANSRKRRGTSSKYKGVTQRKYGWQARLGQENLGRFKVQEDAALAYNKAATQKYGEYAKVNEL